jgi:hypothetical protein
VGEQRVEQAVRTAVVLPREQRLLQLRQHPDHVAPADRLGEVLHPAVQLTHEDRAGQDLRGRGLEDDAVGDAFERRTDDAVLPEPCSPTRSTELRGTPVSAASTCSTIVRPAADEVRGRIVERSLPDTADAAEQLQGPPLLERRA